MNPRIITNWKTALQRDSLTDWERIVEIINDEQYNHNGPITENDMELSFLMNIAIEHQSRIIEFWSN